MHTVFRQLCRFSGSNALGRRVLVAVSRCVGLCAALDGAMGAAGPGLTQVQWSSTEVGKEIVRFSNTEVGPQPTIADFQHGWLYIGAARSVDNSIQGRGSWYDFSNPRSPRLVTQRTIFNNKPHMLTFWEDKMLDGHQAFSFDVRDFDDQQSVTSVVGTVEPLWYMGQIPYVYRPRNGYGAGVNRLDIIRLNPQSTGGDQWAAFDLGSVLSFPVGSVHSVGNLLIASASQAKGVATFDISVPTNPVLLDQVVTGGQVYTSMVHGSRVYQCEQNNTGIIRVYDFSNPADVHEVGTVSIGNNPRYVMLKDGKGYCAPGASRLVRFDAQSLAVDQNWTTGGGMDFLQLIGNMAITGGMETLARCSMIPIQTNPDTTGPTVGFVSPANGATNQAVTSRIGFIMSDQIDVTSLTPQTFIVRPVGTTAPVNGTYSTQLGIVNFSPSAPLQVGTNYEVILPSGGVRDTAGNPIASQWRSVFSTPGAPPGGGGVPGSPTPTLAEWDFNRASDPGFDASLNRRSAQMRNGASASSLRFKEGSYALQLNGSNQSALSVSFDCGDTFTLAAWVYVTGGATSRTILANADTPGSNGFQFAVTSTGKLQLTTRDGGGSITAATGTGVVAANQWVHVAAAVNRTLGFVYLYRDGVPVYSGPNLRNGFTTSGAIAAGATVNGQDLLGGSLDDVRILPRALTGSQIQGLLAGNRYLHARFEGSAEKEFYRNWALGDKQPETLSYFADTPPQISTDAAEGTQSMRFPLPAGSYLFGATSSFNATRFTWTAWLKPDGWAGERTAMASLVQNGFWIGLEDPGTGSSKLVLRSGSGSSAAVLRSRNGVAPSAQWAHYAVAVDGSTGAGKLYVNGVDVTANGTVTKDYAKSSILLLGMNASFAGLFSGLMDDVRVYPTVLTAPQIAAIAGAQNTPPAIGMLQLSSSAIQTGGNLTATATANDADPNDSLLYSFAFDEAQPGTAFTGVPNASGSYPMPGRRFVAVTVTDGAVTTTARALAIAYNPISGSPPARSSLILYDAASRKVWVANPDAGTVSRLDASSLTRDFEKIVGEEPLSLAFHSTRREVWAVCGKSSTVVVLDSDTGVVKASIPMGYGARPSAIVFSPDGHAAYVALQGAGRIVKMDPGSRTIFATADTPQPNALAVTGDSGRLFATRFVSPQTQGELYEFAPGNLSRIRTIPLAYDTSTDTESSSAGVPNYLMQTAISPDGRRLWVPSKKDNAFRGLHLDGRPFTHDSIVRSILTQIDLSTNAEAPGTRQDINDQGLPSAVCFSPLGDLAFVAFIGNDEALVFDTATGNALTGVKTGHAPHALCVDPGTGRLFVLNFLSRNVGVYDIAPLLAGSSSEMTLLAEIGTVSNETLPAQVLEGKRIFYNSGDTRMAADGYISCISCHFDGEQDGRIWDVTDLGEGLRNTISLNGRAGMHHGRVHWSANFDEIQDFEHDMRNRFGGTGFLSKGQFALGSVNQPLGDPKAGLNNDLDALAAYLASLNETKPSPYRAADGKLTPTAVAGARHFARLDCMSCHRGATGTDSPEGLLHDIGTITPGSGHRLGGLLSGIDTPTLKALWATAPYLHDGSAATLVDVFGAAHAPAGSVHARVRDLTLEEQSELIAYLQQYDENESFGTLAGYLESLPPGMLREENADLNGDGVDNITAYAIGGTPSDHARAVGSDSILQIAESGGGPTVRIPFVARPDLAYSLEHTADVGSGSWTTAARKERGGRWSLTGNLPSVVLTENTSGLILENLPGGSGFWRLRILNP